MQNKKFTNLTKKIESSPQPPFEKTKIPPPFPLEDDKRWILEVPEGYFIFKRTLQKKSGPFPNHLITVEECSDIVLAFLERVSKRDHCLFSQIEQDSFSFLVHYIRSGPWYSDDWRRCYLHMIGWHLSIEESAPQSIKEDYMTSTDGLLLLRSFLAWHARKFNLDYTHLISCLDGMFINPESHDVDWELWRKALTTTGERIQVSESLITLSEKIDSFSPTHDTVAEPERWIEETPEGYIVFKKTPREKTSTSPENQLDVVEAYHGATIFLDTLWHKFKRTNYFSETDFYYFEQFYGHFTVDPASIDDWRCSYLKITNRELASHRNVRPLKLYPILDQERMSFEIAFLTLQDLAIWHYKDFGFNFPQFLSLLDSMMSDPQTHAEDWNLWEQSCQRARFGETMGYE